MANAPIFQVWKLRPREQDEGLRRWGRGRCQDSMGHSRDPGNRQSPEPRPAAAGSLDGASSRMQPPSL